MATLFTSRPRRATVLLLAVVALVLPLLPSSPAVAAVVDREAEREFLALVNIERARHGLGSLPERSDMVSVARRHSERMAAQNHLHHNPNLGSEVSDWRRLTENVGYTTGSIQVLHRALMNSSGHRANILDPQVTEVGFGVVISGDRMWLTQVFRLPTNSNGSAPPTLTTFGDVISTSSHAGAIDRVVREGISSGCTEARYCPGQAVTRAQAATFLTRALGLQPTATTSRFSDVSGVHLGAIEVLADHGVISGCTADRFCPDRPVNREQMASLIARAMRLSPASNPFRDVGPTHAGAVGALAARGITSGCTSTQFCPTQAISRAQLATLLDRAF